MKGTKWMVLLCAAIFASSMTVGAAPFDAAYYAAQNPDVVAAIGNDAAALEAHYNAFGAAEGRKGNAEDAGAKGSGAETGGISAIFDAEYYAAHNPDVVAAVGTDPMALYMHFVTTGVNEGRFGNATFNAAAYKAANPDLADTLGGDLAAYANHYMTVGQAEGRSTGISSGSNGSGSNGSGNSSQSENPYARFQNSGSTSGKHSKSSSSEKTEESSSDSENNSMSFTDYTVSGITGPDSLAIGATGTYRLAYTLNKDALPEGFDLFYAGIEDVRINGKSILDDDLKSTNPNVSIKWSSDFSDRSIELTVNGDIGGSIYLTSSFIVAQTGCTNRDDPNNIFLAVEERTKTVTVGSSTPTYAPFTDYTVNGITGPDSLAIGVKGTYDIDYAVNSAAIPEGFELYASIDDLLINNQSIIDNKGQSTDDRVEIEWEDSGKLSFTVKEDIGGSITVYAVFNVRQEGCTGRDDPNNINLALVEPTKTVMITSGTATQASNLSSNIMVTSIGNVQDESDQESSTVVAVSPADAISISEEDDKELDEKIEEDSEEEAEEELETETGEETEEESESEAETETDSEE